MPTSRRTLLSAATATLVGVLGAGCSSSTTNGPVTIDVTIKDGTLTPNGDRIEVGKNSQVTINVTADTDTDVHVHGYEKEIHATAGKTATVTFEATMVGSFEVETHDPARIIATLVVR